MTVLTNKMLTKAIIEAQKNIENNQTFEVHTKEGNIRKITYKIKSIIGRGTFGLVSKIENNGKIQALKTVYQDNRYCNRELDILLDIEHKSIIKLEYYYYSSKTQQGHFLNMCMEYMPLSLEDLLEQKTLSVSIIKQLYKQGLEALAYLHKQNICHRDIKPANLLIDHSFNLKICDFGSAKYFQEGSSNIPYICSRYYRAPENLMGYEKYDMKIDIWSMALTFCEFRTQSPFFPGINSEDMLDKIFSVIEINPDDLKALNYEIKKIYTPTGIRKLLVRFFGNESIVEVLEKSLIVNPIKRKSASELLRMPFFR